MIPPATTAAPDQPDDVRCTDCDGKGGTPRKPCETCGGAGYTRLRGIAMGPRRETR